MKKQKLSKESRDYMKKWLHTITNEAALLEHVKYRMARFHDGVSVESLITIFCTTPDLKEKFTATYQALLDKGLVKWDENHELVENVK